jgi:hypothetical protein
MADLQSEASFGLQLSYFQQVLHGGNLTQQGRSGFVGSGAVEFVQSEGLHGALLTGGPVDSAADEFNLNLRHDL